MSGYGSTRWGSHTKKRTVEECRELSVFDLSREGVIKPGARTSGTWAWWNSTTGERTASISYAVEPTGKGFLVLALDYRFTGETEPVEMQILLMPTYPHFGGVRYWFICPLIVSGQPCNRRVGKIYLPRRGRYFGCRHCYDLAYRSSQESRKPGPLERFIASKNAWDLSELNRVVNRLRRGQH